MRPIASLSILILLGCSGLFGDNAKDQETGFPTGTDETDADTDSDADGDSDSDADGDSDSDADGDTDSDTDGDADGDTDSDTDADTGIALMWYAGGARVSGTTFTSGSFGTDITSISGIADGSIDANDHLCENIGDWEKTGTAERGCPDCNWSFLLNVVDTQADGDYCEQFGRVGGDWDDFEGSWGFAEEYIFSYGSYDYALDTVLMYYFASAGYWSFLAYNYNGYGYNTGNASSMTFHKYYAAYYYYP